MKKPRSFKNIDKLVQVLRDLDIRITTKQALSENELMSFRQIRDLLKSKQIQITIVEKDGENIFLFAGSQIDGDQESFTAVQILRRIQQHVKELTSATIEHFDSACLDLFESLTRIDTALNTT